jgi:hypothetical protein
MRELSAHPDPDALALLQTAIRDQWIKLSFADDSHLLKLLLLQLHAGEAEAIALAAELRADMVLIDEQEGRQLARLASLPVIGVLGILLRAKHSGQLAVIRPEIDALRKKGEILHLGLSGSEDPGSRGRVKRSSATSSSPPITSPAVTSQFDHDHMRCTSSRFSGPMASAYMDVVESWA